MLNIRLLGLLVLLNMFISCNKEEQETKAVNIEIWGYNVGSAELETSVDTSAYRNFITLPDKPVTFSYIYTFPSDKKEASLKIKDKTSGKEVFRQQLSLGGSNLELFFPFVFINGDALKIETPVADAATNKMGFYIHYPQSEDALDIFLRNEAGQILYIAQNVKPGGWIYASYLPQEGFKDKSKPYDLCFTETGTTDGWYFEDSESISKVGESGLFFPKGEEKGAVRTYFITPSALQLEVMRLFKRPEVQ